MFEKLLLAVTITFTVNLFAGLPLKREASIASPTHSSASQLASTSAKPSIAPVLPLGATDADDVAKTNVPGCGARALGGSLPIVTAHCSATALPERFPHSEAAALE